MRSQIDGDTGLNAGRGRSLGAKAATAPQRLSAIRFVQRAILWGTLLAMAATSIPLPAQDALPFEVLNPKNKKWPSGEALRIYSSACSLVAQTVRPERPPHLHPNFRLVLGAADDEVVRGNSMAEIRLKSWDSEKFAEAAVILAAREVLQSDDLMRIVRQTVSLANATVSVSDLRENH